MICSGPGVPVYPFDVSCSTLLFHMHTKLVRLAEFCIGYTVPTGAFDLPT